jgi:hypothetical protein
MDVKILPVKLNALKHHACFLHLQVSRWNRFPWETVNGELQELGNNQFDMYLGEISPADICIEIRNQLEHFGIRSRKELKAILGAKKYKTFSIADGSVWVVRESESGPEYAHIHPARNQKLVRRMKASHIKTAVAWVYDTSRTDAAFREITTSKINELRIRRLGMSPVKSLSESRRIAETIGFLQDIKE